MAIIATVADVFGAPPTVKPAEYALLVLSNGKWLDNGDLPTRKQTDKAYACINHGRWVIECPACPSAQVGDPTDPRFFCIDCGAGWYTVVYPAPKLRAQLEDQFSRVPLPENRNWTPDETLAQVKKSIDLNTGIG